MRKGTSSPDGLGRPFRIARNPNSSSSPAPPHPYPKQWNRNAESKPRRRGVPDVLKYKVPPDGRHLIFQDESPPPYRAADYGFFRIIRQPKDIVRRRLAQPGKLYPYVGRQTPIPFPPDHPIEFLLQCTKRPAFLSFLFLLELFHAHANQRQCGGRTTGITVFKAEIINLFECFLINNDRIAWFFCWHYRPSPVVHIMHRFICSVKYRHALSSKYGKNP